jgi:hypothetical protein
VILGVSLLLILGIGVASLLGRRRDGTPVAGGAHGARTSDGRREKVDSL